MLGQREGVALKPNPAVAEEILHRVPVPRDRVLFVGDSGIDMQTAAAAGIRSVGVTWGFRARTELVEAGADHLIDTPAALLDLL